ISSKKLSAISATNRNPTARESSRRAVVCLSCPAASNLVRSKKNWEFPWFPRPIALRLPAPSLNSLDESPFQEKKSSTAESRSKCSRPTVGACDACASSRWSQKNEDRKSTRLNSSHDQ